MILPLHSAEIVLENGGGKGANLSRLIRSGHPVPDGFIVCAPAYQAFVDENGLAARIAERLERTQLDSLEALESASQDMRGWFLEGRLSAGLEAQLSQAYLALGSPPVAVRSSATAEDLPELSFAGQQDTYLNITSQVALRDALLRCWSSLWTARAIGYRARNGISHDGLVLAVVVQRMVQSQVSGVLFTANPLSGLRSQAVIDATFGLGEALVSGQVDPDQYIVQRDGQPPQLRIIQKTLGGKALAIHSLEAGGTQTVHADNRQVQALPEAVILELAGLGWQVAEEFGAPQDIEWGWAEGRLHLLQSRPITSLYPLPEGMPAEPLHVLVSFGGAQGMLDPLTPFGRDGLIQIVVAVARLLDMPRTPETQRAFFEAGERVYINLTPLLRNKIGRKIARVAMGFIEAGSEQTLNELLADERLLPGRHTFRPATALGLARFVIPTIGRMVRTLLFPEAARRYFIQDAEAILAEFQTLAQEALTFQQKVECFQHVFQTVPRLMMSRAIPTFAPGVYMLSLVDRLAAGMPGGALLSLELTRGLPYNVTTEMDLELWRVACVIQADLASAAFFQNHSAGELAREYQAGNLPPAAQAVLQGFLKRYGMRGVAEIDIGRKRWRDDPTPLIEALLSYMRIEDPARAPDQTFARGAAAADAAQQRLVDQLRGQRHGWFKMRLARFAAGRVRALAGMREYPKFIAVSMMGIIRQMLLKGGESLVQAGLLNQAEDIFYLRLKELLLIAPFQSADQSWDVGAVKGQINLSHLVAERQAVYAREKLRRQVPRLLLSDGRAFYEGVSAAGDSEQDTLVGMAVSPGMVEGRVRVVLNPHQAGLQPGEILVCPGTDPAWTPLFLAAGGLVMEVGGMMTHGSVVAREYGIPAVVGVGHATQRLQTGQIDPRGRQYWQNLHLEGERMNNPEATQQALDLLRSGEPFQWYVITLLALVIYVYANEASKKNWQGIAAGLALYSVHWFYEILNGLVQHFSGHALWTVPTGTAFLLLVGVGVELSLMFSIAGLVMSKLLPADPKLKILGVPNRLLFAIGNAAFFAIFEIFLAKTPAFVWVYSWWGALPVFITVYIPFFLAAFYCYDWPPKRQVRFIGAMFAIDALMLVVFAGFLKWI